MDTTATAATAATTTTAIQQQQRRSHRRVSSQPVFLPTTNPRESSISSTTSSSNNTTRIVSGSHLPDMVEPAPPSRAIPRIPPRRQFIQQQQQQSKHKQHQRAKSQSQMPLLRSLSHSHRALSSTNINNNPLLEKSAEQVFQESLQFSSSFKRRNVSTNSLSTTLGSTMSFSIESNGSLYPSLQSVPDLEEPEVGGDWRHTNHEDDNNDNNNDSNHYQQQHSNGSLPADAGLAYPNSTAAPVTVMAQRQHQQTTAFASPSDEYGNGNNHYYSNNQHDDDDPDVYGVVRIPPEPLDAASLAEKRAAAQGGTTAAAVAVWNGREHDSTTAAHAEGTVVAISDDSAVHPSDLDIHAPATRAEFVAEDYTRNVAATATTSSATNNNETAYPISNAIGADDVAYAEAPSGENHEEYGSDNAEEAYTRGTLMVEGANTSTATEATVIDSAPVKDDDLRPWETAEEAHVLDHQGYIENGFYDSTTDIYDDDLDYDDDSPYDRKPAAVDLSQRASVEDDVFDIRAGLVPSEEGALLRDEYNNHHSSDSNSDISHHHTNGNAIHSAVASLEGPIVPTATVASLASSSFESHMTATAEATAEVVNIHEAADALDDDAATAHHANATAVVGIPQDDTAEVLGIQEEVHPADMMDATARADFVGNDYTVTATASASEVFATSLEEEEMMDLVDVQVERTASDEGLGVVTGMAQPVGSPTVAMPVATTAASVDEAIAATGTVLPMADDDYVVSEEDPFGVTKPRSPSESGPSVHAVPVATESATSEEAFDAMGGAIPSAAEEAENARTPSGGRKTTHLQVLSGNIARGTNNAFVALFGDVRRQLSEGDVTSRIVSRTLLPASVIYSQPTKKWIATLQTNQKALDSNDVTEASKSLRAFSLPSERQAKCLAQAWTPPRMKPFMDYPTCHTCDSRFAVFRRSCHCRNCGVCICKDCAVVWPSKMLPETYNSKKSATVNVCQACDWLCNSFRNALLDGDMDKIVAIHSTGNVNIVCPFGNVKGELFYPVHACVLGGSLKALRWLVDENCCPIKSVRVSGKSRENGSKYTAIVTSRGRSLLSIAMENNNTEIVRYLVVEKRLSITTDRGITPAMMIRNLELALRLIPGEYLSPDEDDFREAEAEAQPGFSSEFVDVSSPPPPTPISERNGSSVSLPESQNSESLNEVARNFGAVAHQSAEQDSECIICFDARIDCVATPCGHQVCCLECSTHLSRCPVCAAAASFMRVFKP